MHEFPTHHQPTGDSNENKKTEQWGKHWTSPQQGVAQTRRVAVIYMLQSEEHASGEKGKHGHDSAQYKRIHCALSSKPNNDRVPNICSVIVSHIGYLTREAS
jgi:hypothetical protein